MLSNKKLLFPLIALLIIIPVSAGCWGYNGECQSDCYIGYNEFSGFSSNAPATCHVPNTYSTQTYYDFKDRDLCSLNNPLQNCYHNASATLTAYNKISGPNDCSSGECKYRQYHPDRGTLVMGCNERLDFIGSGCVDRTKICYRDWSLEWLGACRQDKSCSQMTTKSDCEYGLHVWDLGCYWVAKTNYVLEARQNSATTAPLKCDYVNACPEPYKIDNEGDCVIPLCGDDAFCVEGFGQGYYCENPDEWNAACVPDPNAIFDFIVYKELQGNTYGFFVRTDYTKTPFLDIYNMSVNNLIYYGLMNDEKVTMGETSYSPTFEIPPLFNLRSFSLYSSPTFKRLNYGIFPVCGNGVCETCESQDNCLSYPPESCLSCPKDCPKNSLTDLLDYNLNYRRETEALTPKNIYTDPDDACKVQSKDPYSECNPLCVSHEFIDSTGCIFNKYSNALPGDEYEQKGLKPLRDDSLAESCDFCLGECYSFEDLDEPICLTFEQDPCKRCLDYDECILIENDSPIKVRCGIYKKDITFNNKDYSVFFSNDNNNFYGTNNSLCSNDCECIDGNCAGESFGDKHCCEPGLIWSYNDSKNKYCENGRIKPLYREDLINYNAKGKVVSTIKVIADESSPLNDPERDETGIDANKYICLDNPNILLNNGVENYTSCYEGIDPFCVYGNPNGLIEEYSVIKPAGVGQCREERKETITVLVEDLTCIVHSHTYARAGCNERDWFGKGSACFDGGYGFKPTSFYNWFCVTDNPNECASAESLREYASGIKPVLRSITYKEFCLDKDMVCSSTKQFTNTQNGGTLPYINCPQDGFASAGWFQGVSMTKEYAPQMSIGYYCSLFGNDYNQIMSINAGNKFNFQTKQGTIAVNMSLYSVALSSTIFLGFIPLPLQTGVPEGPFQNFTILGQDNMILMRTPHTPIINRDTNERLYHYLWNYESCVENFGLENDGKGGLVPLCDDVTINSKVYKDEKGYPSWGAVMGRYDMNGIAFTNKIMSREFCEKLWEEWFKTRMTYIQPLYWNYGLILDQNSQSYWSSNSDPNTWTPNWKSLTIDGVTYSAEDVKKMVVSSCFQWYDYFLDAYYSDMSAEMTVPRKDWATNLEIHPPNFDWYWKKAGVIIIPPVLIGADVIVPLDDWIKNQTYCSASGLVNPLQKCWSDYPYSTHGWDKPDSCPADLD